MSSDPSSIVRTSLVGGNDLPPFNDIEKLTSNGRVNIDEQQPIKQIVVGAGWTVDCLTVTYKGADGNLVKITHGKESPDNLNVIDLSDSEYIASASGRAGLQQYYNKVAINSISFKITDRKTSTTRTVGPFGNQNWSNNGETFETGPVVAFGGYADSSIAEQGVRGLYFIGKPGGSLSCTPILVPNVLRSGKYDTGEVHDWQQPVPDTRKTINFVPPYMFGQLPNLCWGLNYLDIYSGANPRVRSLVESSSKDSFVANMQSWSDTKLYGAGISWLDLLLGRGLQGGVIPLKATPRNASTEPFVMANITFNQAFTKAPQLLLWLTGLDMDKGKNWRLKTYPTDVTEKGFVANVATWSDSCLNGAGISWIAVPADSPDIRIGQYSGDQSTQSGQVTFNPPLSGTPTVVGALNALDLKCGVGLRIKTSVENATKEGFKWNINTWSDSYMYWGQGGYIAIS